MRRAWADLLPTTVADTHAALVAAKRPYVSVSGGKDSMVVAHIALKLMPDIEVIHSIHGAPVWLPPQWPGVLVDAVKAMGAMDVRVDRRNLIAVSGYMAEEGVDLVLVGLRRAESARRRERMRTTPQVAAIPELWPIADWSDEAVWSYIRDNDVPYASAYDEGATRWPPHPPEDATDRARWARITYVRQSQLTAALAERAAIAEEVASSPLRFRSGEGGVWLVCGPAALVRQGAVLRVPTKSGAIRRVRITKRAGRGATFMAGDVRMATARFEWVDPLPTRSALRREDRPPTPAEVIADPSAISR